ncbi:hypothetical protein ANN_09721 [Periplaneta americana]|uniref:Uncharacterized protein n=1 Tax=Periplaneta americana TaxID=6978 RepID=A0ABQ8TN46_PERAM|nr:hypothetical protein ANN_09721 [Periplaneta americana]
MSILKSHARVLVGFPAASQADRTAAIKGLGTRLEYRRGSRAMDHLKQALNNVRDYANLLERVLSSAGTSSFDVIDLMSVDVFHSSCFFLIPLLFQLLTLNSLKPTDNRNVRGRNKYSICVL